MSDPASLTAERNKTHGDFAQNARISQRLKQIFRAECKDYETIPQVYKESLDMIALKISRILSGQHIFKDHWDDIAGYAHLAAQATQPAARSTNGDDRGDIADNRTPDEIKSGFLPGQIP